MTPLMMQFEEKIKEIFHFIAEYGIQNKPLDFRNFHKISEQDKYDFLVQVRKGFRIGQDLIIKEIIPIFKERERLKKNEIQAKRNKEKELLAKISSDLKLVEYKIKVLRHFADFIAWQLLKNDYYKARRFYSGSKSRPDILNSNLQSVLDAVEYFHSQDDMNFALISDLTSFIDIGDILLAGNKKMSIIECKDGEVQSKVFEFLNEIIEENFDVKQLDFSDKNFKFLKQAKRTLRQFEKGNKLTNFLKNEEGTDPFSDSFITVFESTNPREYYYEYLINLIQESKINNYARGEIEEIIYIGVYRGPNDKGFSSFFFNEVIKQVYEKYIAVDYLSIIGLPLKEPLFFKPFGVETIFDIMFGRVQIFLAINLDKLIDLFNERGVKARWLSRKETQKFVDSSSGFKPFIYQYKTIEIIVNGHATILSDSFLLYLLFDNITPSSYVERYNNIRI